MPLDEFSHYFSESKISTKQRKKLDDSQFGIPSLRKYPLTDEKHVLQAVRFFKKAPEEHKPELARNIVKRAKELNMDWEKWDVLKPYLDKPVKEAYAKELHSTPEADNICAYLCKSVKYDNASPKTWRLKSPDEVTDHNKGNCHDTAWYVFKNLDAYAKRKVGKGILFFIEYKEGKKEGGQTHSVCYEKIPGGICIIECSWQGMTGTFPYNNINEYVSVVKNNWEFTGDNDKLYATEIKNTSQIHPGMTLSEYVFVAMKNKEIITESYDPQPDGDHTSGTSDFDHDNDDPDDCYCESEDINGLVNINMIVSKIHDKCEKDGPDNNNCLLCSWCAESWMRGYELLPRPVYSPRDPALEIFPEDVIDDTLKHVKLNGGFDKLISILKSVDVSFARWYCHVKWGDGHGGHEFLIVKTNNKFYVMDAQAGTIEPITKKCYYFKNIIWEQSYVCRIDDKRFNYEKFKEINDPKNTIPWNGTLDIPYMLKEGMLSEEEAEQYWKEHPDERPETHNVFTSGDFDKYGKDVDLTDARGPIQEGFFGPSSMKIRNTIEAAIKLPGDYRTQLFSSINGKPMISQYDNKKIDSVSSISHWLTPREIYDDIIQRRIQTNIPKIIIAKLKPSGTLSIHNGDENIYINTTGSDERFDKSFGTFTDLVNTINADQPVKVVIDGYMDENQLYDEYGGKGILLDFFKIYSDKKFYALINNFNRLQMSNNAEKHYSKDLRKAAEKIFIDPTEDERNGRVKYFMHPDDLFTDSDGNDCGIGFAGVDNADEYMCISCKDGKIYYMNSGDPKYLVSNSFADFLKSFEDGFFDAYLNKRSKDQAVQESAWQDIKNGVNPFSKNLVFHISKNGALDGQIFKPRVPEYITKYDSTDPKFEDNTTGRICFSPSIEGCLNAILVNIGRWKTADKLGDWYVYIPEKPLNEYKHSSNRDIIKGKKVYDANLTKEIWIEEPVRLKQYGVIHVDQVKASDRKKTVATSNNVKGDRRYYTFKWHWLVKPKVLKDIPYDYSKHETCENLESELWRFGYGLIKDGKLMKGNISEKDWYKYWRLADPEDFEQAKGGNCYDYVEWESGYLDAFGHDCNKIFIKSSTGNNHAFIYVKDDSKYIFIDGAFNKIDKTTHIMKEFDSLDKCFKYITDAIKKYEKNDSISFTFYDYTKEDMKPGTPMKEFEEWIISHCKKVNTDKPIKEEYNMSDFERDPSVLQMILEAEAEENKENDNDDDEKGDAIEGTEISIEGEAEIGSDVGDVQNEYNPEEVERINKLINSEMSAVSEYFNAAKESKEPNLMRLFSDIGDEERFHLEQLIYAKSTITGEAYEPQDPKVKKEYQELLDMGMDEETAMTTAVDKVQLMPKEATEDMSEDEAADFEESFRLISTSSLQTAVMLEAAIDTSDIALQISENSTAFLEQMIIMEEVDNLNTRQGQKDLGTKNPIAILIKAFVAIYGAIIGLARKARLAFQKIRLRDKRKWAWIKKHGIGAIFAKGVSFYFFSEKKNMYDVGEPMKYIGLIHSMNEAIIKSCNITTISPNKYDINGYTKKLVDTAKGTNREINITPIAARNTEDGIRLLQGVSLMKTKVVLTQENTPILEEQFFGYTERNYAMIEKEGDNTKNIRLSVNVYNQMSILLDALAALGSETKLVMEALNNQEGTQGTTYDKMPGVWKSAIRAIGVMEKSVSKFNSAVAADVSEMIKVNNGLKEAMETADTTGDTSAVNQHKNDVAQQQKANAEESKKNAERKDTVATERTMA